MYAYKISYTLSVYNKPRLVITSANFTIDVGEFTPYEDTTAMDWHNINEVLENSFSLPFGRRVIISSKRKGKELFILNNYNQTLTFKEWKDPLLNASLTVKKIKYNPTLEEVGAYKKLALASAYINEHFKETE